MFGQKDTSVEASITRGDAARDRRDWAGAASAYQAALNVKPDQPHIWVQYGHVLKEDDRVGEAVDAYREAMKREPDQAETQVHLAHALKRLDRPDEALEAFEKALALDPADEDSAQELFSLQQRLNVVPQTPEPDREEAAPPSQSMSEMQTAILKEREASAAAELRLSALQTLHMEVQAENDALKEQVKGQQAEIEKQRGHEAARREMTAARDALLDDIAALKEQIKDQQAEIEKQRGHETARREMAAARTVLLGDVEALKEQVKGQQDEIEKRRNQNEERLKAVADARDALLIEVEALKRQISDQQDEIDDLKQVEETLDTLRDERDKAHAEIEALKSRMQESTLRTDLAKKEFLRSEGQIALIKDMFLHEGGL